MSFKNTFIPPQVTDHPPRSPAFLQRIGQRIQRWAQRVADFQARLILTILYVLFVAPVGLALRWSGDVFGLHPRLQRDSYWQVRVSDKSHLRNLRGQG